VTDRAPADSIARPGPTETDTRPTPKRRKKRKGSSETPRGRVPGFVRDFPREPELDRLVEAFECGNYALVRAGAARLAKDTESDDVRRAARELLRRINPDPLAVILVLAAVVLLAFLAAWYWSHGHAGT
jgi:hypothetical protein